MRQEFVVGRAMKTAAQASFAERTGRAAAAMWHVCVLLDLQAGQRLAAKGWPPRLARVLIRVTELFALVALSYAALWAALAVSFLFLAAWIAARSMAFRRNDPEWREGHAGFGLYDKTEWRHDMGDPDGS
jgi:hypothetical protein